ncbi:carbon catabolite repressor protein 4 homolog 1-like [Silene latifolia]|uniref:carbon catabolite repressor protein 4 homolog 1-like n=1 Tax=Silene latifolia TaxID=37657 RepID=UPI003D78749B
MVNKRKMIDYHGNDGSLGKDENSIKILTYNILAAHVPTTTNWDERKSKLLEELKDYKADVMCLQEVVDTDVTEFFGPQLLVHGYEYIMNTERNDMYFGPGNNFKMGCAIFYKSSSFRVNKNSPYGPYKINFRRAARQFLRDHNLENPENAIRYLKDKAGIGCMLEFRPQKKKIMIFIVTVHLTANEELSDVKLLQTYLLLKGLSIIEKEKIPIIVAGDFNIIPKSEPYMMITNRQMPKPAEVKKASTDETAPKDETAATDKTVVTDETVATDKTAPKDGTVATNKAVPTVEKPGIDLGLFLNVPPMAASLESAYSTVFKPGSHKGLKECRRMNPKTMEPIFTTASNAVEYFKNTIDYIFYTKEEFSVEGILEPIDDVEVLPTEDWPSDHIALMANMQLKKKRKMVVEQAKFLRQPVADIWNKRDENSPCSSKDTNDQEPETSANKEAAADQECETSSRKESVYEEYETSTSKDAADQECETSSSKEHNASMEED